MKRSIKTLVVIVALSLGTWFWFNVYVTPEEPLEHREVVFIVAFWAVVVFSMKHIWVRLFKPKDTNGKQ